MGWKKARKSRGIGKDGRGWEKEGENGTDTHRLLGLPAHDEGIRQRRSRRSRHFSVYFLSVAPVSLSTELVRPPDHTRFWKLNLMDDEPFKPTPGYSRRIGSFRFSNFSPSARRGPKLKKINISIFHRGRIRNTGERGVCKDCR